MKTVSTRCPEWGYTSSSSSNHNSSNGSSSESSESARSSSNSNHYCVRMQVSTIKTAIGKA